MSKARGSNSSQKDQDEAQHLIREIIFQIRKLIQAGSLYTKELNKKYQISASQLNVLLTLQENGPLPLSQIARHILVKSSTVTGITDRLEQKGLVKRIRSSPDRRVIIIELTTAGEMMAENAPPPIQQKIMDGLRKLPSSEKEKILQGLKKLTRMLDVHDLEVDVPLDLTR
jgi:DNA-binding MarR family transcriptional regulator